MKPDKRTKFLTWYDERVAENYVFDFKKELVAYCHSDIDILRRNAMMLREDFLKIGNIDPLQYITIASVCLALYSSKYMPKDTIGIIKNRPHNTYSKTSIQSLRWESNVDNVYIQHAMNAVANTLYPRLVWSTVFVKQRTRSMNSKDVFGTGVQNVIHKIGLTLSTNGT